MRNGRPTDLFRRGQRPIPGGALKAATRTLLAWPFDEVLDPGAVGAAPGQDHPLPPALRVRIRFAVPEHLLIAVLDHKIEPTLIGAAELVIPFLARHVPRRMEMTQSAVMIAVGSAGQKHLPTCCLEDEDERTILSFAEDKFCRCYVPRLGFAPRFAPLSK